MLSYRHAFHAGNHADVLKHAVFVHILDYYNRKDTPYWVIDTHAGAGIYDLTSEWALKNGEFVNGLDRILSANSAVPTMISRYIEEVRCVNPDGVANLYPGSPWLALQAMRDRDRLRLFEMHPSEAQILKENLAQQDHPAQRQTAVFEQDGFAGLKSLLPPPPRRAITIIDPSYENKNDYRQTLSAVNDGLKRFQTGCFMVWYPLIQRVQAQELVRSLSQIRAADWVQASLTVCKPAPDGMGLHGSGVFIINPPWTLHDELEKTLPWLSQILALDEHGSYTLTRR